MYCKVNFVVIIEINNMHKKASGNFSETMIFLCLLTLFYIYIFLAKAAKYGTLQGFLGDGQRGMLLMLLFILKTTWHVQMKQIFIMER